MALLMKFRLLRRCGIAGEVWDCWYCVGLLVG